MQDVSAVRVGTMLLKVFRVMHYAELNTPITEERRQAGILDAPFHIQNHNQQITKEVIYAKPTMDKVD